ncbi:MAG TPA: GIY-YIG nuclease family protein [Gammaproteobacteria bacterium]|nr:GIY-YIG nuclease family protein [Gammaproteobacteria bacterium]
MLTNIKNTVLYTGVTNDIIRRVYEHKNKLQKGFTSKYYVNKLMYYEMYSDVSGAIAREKQIKGWTRKKKDNLIKTLNPLLRDLYEEIC